MGRFIPDDVLEQIRMRADIVEVVQSYVPTLKKAGGTWKACCPFHQEKTPSFTVNPARGIYKCFGCGKAGNALSFVMEMERLDFPNAAEFLARKYNIMIPDTDYRQASGKKYSRADAEQEYNLRERLYQLHEKLAEWYRKNLQGNRDSAVAKYFITRGLPPEIAAQFMIGASPDSWDAAILYAKREKFTDQELRLSGIVSEKEEQPDHIYDRFRNRLMFPIWNEQGRIIAFSARSVEPDPKGWKYVNSPESPVFKKSRTLYALHFARKSIADRGFAILCEGQLDVIAMHRAGCTCAVAPQGTAFGDEQAAILRRYTRSVCLALDNDHAGREAVFKDALILLPKGFSLKVVVYPGAKDADELLKKQGPDAVVKAVAEAVDFFEFALNAILPEAGRSTPAEKAAAVKRMLDFLILPDDAATRDLYAGWLGERLGIDKESILSDLAHRHSGLEEQRLRQERRQEERAMVEAERASVETSEVPAPLPLRSERHPGLKKVMLELLELLLRDEQYAARAGQDIESDMLDESPTGRAVELVIQAKMNEEWADAPGAILMMFSRDRIQSPEITARLPVSEENTVVPGDGDDDEARRRTRREQEFAERLYLDCIGKIRKQGIADRRAEIIARATSLPDGEEKTTLMREALELSRQLLALGKH